MSTPFPTSLRRNPGDPRGLQERIEAQMRERLEETVDFFCLDLLVQLRRRYNRPLPREDSQQDRAQFHELVSAFLEYLWEAFVNRLSATEAERLRQLEASAKSEARLIAIQSHLARSLPDYWQTFEEIKTAFTQERLAAPEPKPSRPR
jgi:hypothetical protein